MRIQIINTALGIIGIQNQVKSNLEEISKLIKLHFFWPLQDFFNFMVSAPAFDDKQKKLKKFQASWDKYYCHRVKYPSRLTYIC